MSEEEGTILMRHFIYEWNKGDMETLNRVIEQTVDPNFVDHSAAAPEYAGGPDGVKNVFGEFRAAFPDGRTTTEDTIEEGDTVVTRWTFRGAPTGASSWASLPRAGR